MTVLAKMVKAVGIPELVMLCALMFATNFLMGICIEYLWALWFLVRFIYDSVKYQGLALAVSFICIALTDKESAAKLKIAESPPEEG